MTKQLLLNDAHGIYIPQLFAKNFFGFEGIDEEDLTICRAGPDHEHYWDAWDNILNHAYSIDKHGFKYILHQDGDLWAYCPDQMTEEEKEEFYS